MKILYASGNNINSKYQLQNYYPVFTNSNHQFLIASFKENINNIPINYCLDALLNFLNPSKISFNNNFYYYTKEIVKLAPDLIISDLEIFASIIAIENKIPLWQMTPLLLPFSISHKQKFKSNKFDLNSNYGSAKIRNYYKSIIYNSDKNLINSSICMEKNLPDINSKFEWCLPPNQENNNRNNIENLMEIL